MGKFVLEILNQVKYHIPLAHFASGTKSACTFNRDELLCSDTSRNHESAAPAGTSATISGRFMVPTFPGYKASSPSLKQAWTLSCYEKQVWEWKFTAALPSLPQKDKFGLACGECKSWLQLRNYRNNHSHIEQCSYSPGEWGGWWRKLLNNTDWLYNTDRVFLRPLLMRIISWQKKISVHVNDSVQHTGRLHKNLTPRNKNREQFKVKQEILNSLLGPRNSKVKPETFNWIQSQFMLYLVHI